jgi:hydroxymethylglutaryl-CoA lyase
VATVIAEGKVRTYDMGGSATTLEMGRGDRAAVGALAGPAGRREAITSIVLHEVGPRDGLQIEKAVVPTEQKIAWIERAPRSGVDIVQVGLLRPPGEGAADGRHRRALRGTSAGRRPGGACSGLVLNEKGLERGLACGVDDVLHGRLGLRDAQPQEHRDGHEEATADRRAAKRPSRRARRCRSRSSRRSAAASRGRSREERVLDIVRAASSTPACATSASPTPPATRRPTRSRSCSAAARARRERRVRLPLPRHLRPRPGQRYAALRGGRPSSSRRSPASAAARSRRSPAATCAPRTSCTLQRMGLRTDIDLDALIDVARDVARVLRPRDAGPSTRPAPSPTSPAPASRSMKLLDGVRVLDLTNVLAGPFARCTWRCSAPR